MDQELSSVFVCISDCLVEVSQLELFRLAFRQTTNVYFGMENLEPMMGTRIKVKTGVTIQLPCPLRVELTNCSWRVMGFPQPLQFKVKKLEGQWEALGALG